MKVKTMNNNGKKYIATIESKKQTKQTRTERESWIWRAFDGCQMGGWWWGMGEKVRGLRSTDRQLQISHGDVKYSIAKEVAKAPMHDLWT